jgi:integrase
VKETLILERSADSLSSAVHMVLGEIFRTKAFTERSERRFAQAMNHLASYLAGVHGIHELAEVTPAIAREILAAPLKRGGGLPSCSTMKFRRSVLRRLFSAARQLDLVVGDPTLDLVLTPMRAGHQRPLTDHEVARCRAVAEPLIGTRYPAAWALGEATARTSELPHLRVSDVDVDLGRVWLHGASKLDPRWGVLTPWGLRQLAARTDALGGTEIDAFIVYQGDGSGDSRQASACEAISTVLKRAGLGSAPDLGPGSVAAWAGVSAFTKGNSIQVVARILGVRSLDQASRLIGWAWDERFSYEAKSRPRISVA